MKTVCILVTFNRLPLLKRAVENIIKNTDSDLLVVDNSSTDGTGPWLDSLDSPRLSIRHLDRNIGGAGGFSFGLQEAVKGDYEAFWLMDDDTMVGTDSLPPLQDALRNNPEAAFASSLALWTDGNPNRMNEQRKMEKDTGQKLLRIREATFVSLLVPRTSVEKNGFPIPDFFIWGDDIEYTRRLSSGGFGLLVRDSKVIHETATNTGSDISKDEESRLGRYRFAYRNEVFMARKEGLYRCLRQLAKIIYHSGKVLAFSENKGKRLRIIWASSREGMRFNPDIPRWNREH